MDFLLRHNYIILPDMVQYNIQNIISTVLYYDNTNSIPYYLLKSLLKPQILLLINYHILYQSSSYCFVITSFMSI